MNEYEGECGAEVKRPKKVWGITDVHSSPVAVGGEKPVVADDIFTHFLAASAAAISVLMSCPQRFFTTCFPG